MRHGLILAGGGGTRLWPASRPERPKQFLRLVDPSQPLIGAAFERLGFCDATWVVTSEEQAVLVAEALPGLPPSNILREPSARNTAAALGLSAIFLRAQDDEALFAATPADQHIADPAQFQRCLELAFAAAEEEDCIVTIGIVPTRPETGYGYLHLAESGSVFRESGGVKERAGSDVRKVDSFVEKPDRERALAFLQGGKHLWNAGIFVCKARVLLEEIDQHAPDIAAPLREIETRIAKGEDWQEIYHSIPARSIDYAVMERSQRVRAVAGRFGWDDVGSWDSLADCVEKDERGNLCQGNVLAIDSKNNLLISEGEELIATVGLQDTVVVASGGSILVTPRGQTQRVKEIVTALRNKEESEK